MELDDWELSNEEFESLERDALCAISQRYSSSSSSSSSCTAHASTSSYAQQHQPRPRPSVLNSTAPSSHSVIAKSPQCNKSDAFSPGPIALPTSPTPKRMDNGSKELPKLPVKFFLHASGNVAARFTYNSAIVAAFHKVPKASWNAKERLWMFPISSLSAAEQVLSDVNSLNVQIENLDPLVQRAIKAACAIPDIRDQYDRIPSYIESKLLPFQRDGVRFVLQHGGRALLADEMGLGKTLQAIAVSTCVRDAWPVLVLTPSSLRLQWASMLKQWLDIPSSDILVVLSQCGGSNKAGFTIVQSNKKGTIHLDGIFNIISYDVVPKLQDILMTSKFKVVIADESHFLKNAQAKRTSAAVPILQKAQYAILLSGTPALSRPIELFKQLEVLYPDVYKNVHEYGSRYCKGGIFGMYQGASNHEELHNLMKATVLIRRLKKDVLSELPVKRRQHVFLDLAEKDMKPINALFHELELVKNKIKVCKAEEAESLKLTQKNLINKIYNDSAEAKIPAVLDYIGTVIEAGCKFIVFAHHQPMINSLHEFLLKKKVGCIRIDGGTPPASRQALVMDFQEKDSIKAAVLSIKAGGVGLTLTAATTVIFAELSWTPGDLTQAEDRAHRIGQVSSVNVYYLLASDTVDDIIWDVVQSKLENLGQMLDGQENSMEISGGHPRGSPAKQTSVCHPRDSPTKQRTLDSFIKRCSNLDESQKHNFKHPRH